ncbi:NAD(P)H-binding protein [Myxococcota bacterium]|nr:NAD(P)H-binding protein [Myxococcota bacterium]
MSSSIHRILVTGANGHLGGRLIERLAADPNLEVRAVVRSEAAAAQLERLPLPSPLEVHQLDYSDADALTQVAEGCETAVHLVGIIKESATSRFATAHESTSRALAEAAHRADLSRIIYLSILGTDPNSPNPCLGSKGRAERILLESPTPTLVLRVPMVIGRGDHVSRALRGQACSRIVGLLRGGASLEQPIDAQDVVSALRAGAIPRDDTKLDDQSLDLAGPEILTRRALLERCAALYGRKPLVIPIPLAVANGAAALLERFTANPPVSRAMLGVLDHDDNIDPSESCRRLGIQLTPLEETLRRCVGPEEAP